MPAARRRHALTETARVQAAPDGLLGASGPERTEVAESVVPHPRKKVGRARGGQARLRQRLARRVRDRLIPIDLDAADEVRRIGWARG